MIPQRRLIPLHEVEILREARSVLETEASAIRNASMQLDQRFAAVVNLLVDCQGAVVMTGIGKAGLIAKKIVATFSSLGIPSLFLHPTEALHGDLGCVQLKDTIIAFSNSGETEELLQILPTFQSWGLPIVAITSTEQNSLARQSTHVIPYGRHPEAGMQGLPPTSSTTVMLAIGDALALVSAKLRGFNPQGFARLHPGGNLGKKLLPVREIMRSGDSIRIASEQATVREVFSQNILPSRRTGAVMLVDDQQKLTGLFTDSDLARLLERHREELIDAPIRDVMTKNPITIRTHTLLGEVVEILSRKKVSELPVVADDDTPIGMVDITDVIGLIPLEDV
jgi:arabinose-5-phosphate isomerase